jgi:acetylornithine deacetylase/succinyl-diaminopimelate desuccinylase-like protein
MGVRYQLADHEIEQIKMEATALLSRYLKINTSNPPGDTTKAVEFFKELFVAENIPHKVYEYSSTKKSIMACIKSNRGEQKPLLLLNHMDVVPADKTKWKFDPFQGEVIEGDICGRGSLDMKGMTIAQLLSLIVIKRKGIELKRDLIFLAVADEELGGFHGAKYIVENYFDEINPEVVLDEGGMGFKTNSNQPVFFVSCSQKKALWLRIKAMGESGHGSRPTNENPNNILLNALVKLINYEWTVDDNSNINHLIKALVRKNNSCTEFFNTIVRNTLSVTMLKSGENAVNVIPSTAEATIDCRLLPDANIDTILELFKKIIDDKRINIEVIKRTDHVDTSNIKSNFMSVIDQVIKNNFNNAKIIPFVTPVGTDSKYFRQKGVEAYGLFPILINLHDLKTIHGINEKISIENLVLGTKIIYEICIDYCI